MLALAFSDEKTLRRLAHSTLVSVIIVTIISAYVISQILYKGAYRTDALAFSHYSAILFLSGKNPYAVDLEQALTMFSVDPTYITFTPTMDISTNFAYPALHFLYLAPFVAAGLKDMRPAIFLFEILTIVFLYRKAPSGIRPLIMAPIFINADLVIDFGAGSVTDAMWVLPMVAMVFVMNDPVRSGILYGVACATKQQPWLLAPFVVVWMYNMKPGGRVVKLSHVLRFIIAGVIAFTIPNLPFMVMNFQAWFVGVLSPASGGLVILSQGLSAFTQAGLLPLPPVFYLAVTVAVLATLLGNYIIYFDKIKHAMWIFPAIIMWFSYRALQNYFMYWVPVLVAAYLSMEKERG
jgi:uncharacterized membrane protein